jgi:hypothetical protein
VDVGKQVGKEILLATTIPEGLSESEKISFLASWVNKNVYASPDVPKIISDRECTFDILWGPHQDIYTARDCQIQRYSVEGILDSFNTEGYNLCARAKEKGEEVLWRARSKALAQREV